MKSFFRLSFTSLALTCAALGAQAQTALTAPAQRITDEAISADQRAYEGLQSRIKGLNDRGRPVRDYHLAKAQCWLDVSFHEYTRNDRSPFPDLALGQAGLLAGAMEASRPVGWDTPLVNDAERLRADLWSRAATLRSGSGWPCAQAKAACAEVELVHAGNEQRQQGWRHAKPYVQIAEDLLGEAEALAAACAPPPMPQPAPAAHAQPAAAVAAVLPPPPTPVQPPPPAGRVQVAASVVFNFDRHAAADMRPYSVAQIKALAERLQRDGLVVRRLVLAGHADRLNGTRQSDYNQRLSEKRVATVRDALAALGVPVGAAEVQALGDGQQVQACAGRFASTADLQECLLPNRRVDILIEAEQPAAR